ncbi:MAG: hypothetical protein QM762_16940 [Chryseolinea sp.]
MRVVIFLILIVIGTQSSFGQDAHKSYASMIKALLVEFDTTYFESGQIETITRQVIVEEMWNRPHEVKVVYQYDACGNWRNATTVYEESETHKFEMIQMPRRWQMDKLAVGARCSVAWQKPFIY